MRKMFLFFLIFIIQFSIFNLSAQNSRFERVFLTSAGALATGKVIYIVNTSTSDSLLLTEVVGKPGYYRKDSVPYGEYKVYIDGSLSTQSIWVGSSRIRSFIEGVDSDGDNKVETAGIENSAVTTAKIADEAVTPAKLADPLDLSSLTITYPDSQVGLNNFSTAAYNYIGSGGSVTNNPDDQTLENVGVDNIGLKENYAVAANIAALESWAKHDLEIGDIVYLREVTSGGYGGGEMVYVDSTDLKARIGSAVVDSVIIFHAPETDRVWYRTGADGGGINVRWAGAMGDGSTDDISSFNKAQEVANRYGAQIYIPQGDYILSSAFIDTSATTSVRTGFSIVGENVGKTRLLFSNNTNGIEINTVGRKGASFVIRNLSIVNSLGSSTSTGSGIFADSTANGIIENCHIYGWKYGIKHVQSNAMNVKNCFIELNWAGIWGETSPNENFYFSNYVNNNDSINYYQSSGIRNSLKGGAIANTPIAFYIDNGGSFSAEDVNVEGTNSRVVKVANNATVHLKAVSGTIGVYPTGFRFAEVGSGFLFLESCGWSPVPSDTCMILHATTSFNSTRIQQTPDMSWMAKTNTGLIYRPGWTRNLGNNLRSTAQSSDSLSNAVLWHRVGPNSASLGYPEDLFYRRKLANGVYQNVWLSDGSDWRFTINKGTSYSNAFEHIVFVSGYGNVLTDANDSVRVKIPMPETLTGSTVLFASATARDTLSGSNSNVVYKGTEVDSLVFEYFDNTNAVNTRLFIFAIIQAAIDWY